MNAPAEQMMVTLFRPSFGSRRTFQVVRCFQVGAEGSDVAHKREIEAATAAIRSDYPRANVIGCRWLNPAEIASVKAGNAPALFEL